MTTVKIGGIEVSIQLLRTKQLNFKSRALTDQQGVVLAALFEVRDCVFSSSRFLVV